MDALQLWAMVSFTARGGNTEGLLNAAASGGLHLSRLTAQPDGFAGQCAAWRYRRLASMARRRRVRLRIQKRICPLWDRRFFYVLWACTMRKDGLINSCARAGFLRMAQSSGVGSTTSSMTKPARASVVRISLMGR